MFLCAVYIKHPSALVCSPSLSVSYYVMSVHRNPVSQIAVKKYIYFIKSLDILFVFKLL